MRAVIRKRTRYSYRFVHDPRGLCHRIRIKFLDAAVLFSRRIDVVIRLIIKALTQIPLITDPGFPINRPNF